jgi:virulence-associated protein VagC
MAIETHARLFWSGGSQAVRLPKAMRLPGKQVIVRRRGTAVILEPLPEADDWAGFWEQILPLARPIRRGKTRRAERRAPL